MPHSQCLRQQYPALSLCHSRACSHFRRCRARYLTQRTVADELGFSGRQEVQRAQGLAARPNIQNIKQKPHTNEVTSRHKRRLAQGASDVKRQVDLREGRATPDTPQSATGARQRHKRRSPQKHDPVVKTLRGSVIKQLLRIETEGAFAGLVARAATLAEMNEPAEAELPDPFLTQNARQGTFFVNNIVRWQRQLDFYLANLMHQPLGDSPPALRAILRLGAFELLSSDTPAHAVSQHVQLTKALVHPGVSKITNAILRKLIRLRDAKQLMHPPLPTPGTPLPEAAEQLGVAQSHPTWMVLRWLHRWGSVETLALLQHNNRSTVQHCVRVVPESGMTQARLLEELQAADVQACPSQVLPQDFIKTPNLQHLLRQGFIQRGLCQVQDEAAGLVVALLDPQPGEAILDACAAPGGKALYAASRMQGQGRLVAMDVSGARLKALETASQAQGLQKVVQPVERELCEYAAWVAQQDEGTRAQHQYDRVLLDAPCTGLGVLSKRADLRWRRTPQELGQLITLQEQLLDAAASLVKPGGLLVYSTCSIETEENQDQVTAFLGRQPHFQVEAGATEVPARLITEEGCFQSLPHKHDMDGAFGARLRQIP